MQNIIISLEIISSLLDAYPFVDGDFTFHHYYVKDN